VTRQRIVAAAVEVMAEKGALGASLDEVGARAPASRSQIYHYFDDKSDLLCAVAESMAETVIEDHRRLLTGVNSWDGLQQWVDSLVGLHDKKGANFQIANLIAQLSEGDDVRAVLARALQRWEANIQGCLAAMVAAGELRSDVDLDWLAASTLASLQGGTLLAEARSNSRALRQALDGAVALLVTYRRK